MIDYEIIALRLSEALSEIQSQSKTASLQDKAILSFLEEEVLEILEITHNCDK